MDDKVAKTYGNRVRVRACGLCWDNERLLLVNHKGVTSGNFWAPPGGGVEFGESIASTLKKEFMEETALEINPIRFLFGCEYIAAPIHSIELFYAVERVGGRLRTGHDPELQIIDDVRFMTPADIHQLALVELHGIFRFIKSADELKTLTGFYTI